MSEEIIAEKFPNIRKERVTQEQETQRVQDRVNPRNNMPRYIAMILTKKIMVRRKY